MVAPSPVPALPDATRSTAYAVVAPNVGPFPVSFALYGDGTDYGAWLEVWMGGVQLTAVGDWTLSSPSGSLAALARPITDAVVTLTTPRTGSMYIVGARRPRRLAQFSEGRGVTARDDNQTYTDIIATQREMWDNFDRTLQAPYPETLALLVPAAQRANLTAIFDSQGNLTAGAALGSGTVSAAMQPVMNAATLALGRMEFGLFDTRAAIAAMSVDAAVLWALTAGYSAVGDGGGALYKQVGANPGVGGVQSANGIWFALVRQPEGNNPRQFGAIGDGNVANAAIDTAAFLACISFCQGEHTAAGSPGKMIIPKGQFYINDELVQTAACQIEGVGRYAELVVAPSMPAGKNLWKIVAPPDTGASGINWSLGNFSVTTPTPGAGLNMVEFNTPNGQGLFKHRLHEIWAQTHNMTGIAVYLNNPVATNVGYTNCIIEDCVFAGVIQLLNTADNTRIVRNSFLATAGTLPLITMSNVPGAAGNVIAENNLGCWGTSGLRIIGGQGTLVTHNYIEQTPDIAFRGTDPSLVIIETSVGLMMENNLVIARVVAQQGINAIKTIGDCEGTEITRNYISADGAGGKFHLIWNTPVSGNVRFGDNYYLTAAGVITAPALSLPAPGGYAGPLIGIWLKASLLNGWLDHNVANYWDGLYFRHERNGDVSLRGSIRAGTVAADTQITSIFAAWQALYPYRRQVHHVTVLNGATPSVGFVEWRNAGLFIFGSAFAANTAVHFDIKLSAGP